MTTCYRVNVAFTPLAKAEMESHTENLECVMYVLTPSVLIPSFSFLA